MENELENKHHEKKKLKGGGGEIKSPFIQSKMYNNKTGVSNIGTATYETVNILANLLVPLGKSKFAIN